MIHEQDTDISEDVVSAEEIDRKVWHAPQLRAAQMVRETRSGGRVGIDGASLS